MARGSVIVTGNKQLTKLLNALGSKVARELHQKASKVGAQLVLAQAQKDVQVKSGAYRKSLTVRTIARSRKGIGFRVTQRGGVSRKDKDGAFYGGFQEFGWRATGRPRTKDKSITIESKTAVFAERERETKSKAVTTYRGGKFTINQLRQARKIPGSWVLRTAGTKKEVAAIALYHEVLGRLIDTEASR